MRVVNCALAAVGPIGVWAAVRGYRNRSGSGSGSGKLLVVALTCGLGSGAVLVVLRSMA